MAAIDKIYGTRKQRADLVNWLDKNCPLALDFVYPEDYFEDKDEKYIGAISNFPGWTNLILQNRCPLEFVQEALSEQYDGAVPRGYLLDFLAAAVEKVGFDVSIRDYDGWDYQNREASFVYMAIGRFFPLWVLIETASSWLDHGKGASQLFWQDLASSGIHAEPPFRFKVYRLKPVSLPVLLTVLKCIAQLLW